VLRPTPSQIDGIEDTYQHPQELGAVWTLFRVDIERLDGDGTFIQAVYPPCNGTSALVAGSPSRPHQPAAGSCCHPGRDK
jgi:hypothetical protein